jgi:Uncharacterized protein conserved in bacteria (DUF2188)
VKLFEIPFCPESEHGWTIPIPGDGEKQFRSRDDALAFALQLAKQQRYAEGKESFLCVEGADGQWRLFTPDLLPVK